MEASFHLSYTVLKGNSRVFKIRALPSENLSKSAGFEHFAFSIVETASHNVSNSISLDALFVFLKITVLLISTAYNSTTVPSRPKVSLQNTNKKSYLASQ